MNRRVLIISPHFPPTNAPDHQRVRMALPHLQHFGWDATTLAVRPTDVEGVTDPMLEESLPANARVIKTGALPHRMTRKCGLGSLGWRALPYLHSAGSRLLSREKFDLVFFSTTQFPVMALGPAWRRRFGVRYVLDFQDPWRNDYYDRTGLRPPGGRFKYQFAKLEARLLEPYTLRQAAHVICVSPAYPDMFLARYPKLQSDLFSVLPFAGSEEDFELIRKSPVRHEIFNPGDGKQHWVYVGAAGERIRFSIRALFRALAEALQRTPELRFKLRLHFVGTDYAAAGRGKKSVEPLALEYGVADLITEQPGRIPHFAAIQCLLDADALILPGSDDAGYTASKLYPYILARRPLLAIFHETSSVVEILRRTGAGTLVTFNDQHDVETMSEEIYQRWFEQWPLPVPQTDWAAFEPYTAKQMSSRLCNIFDAVI